MNRTKVDDRSGARAGLGLKGQDSALVTVYYTWIHDNLAPDREARWLAQLSAEKRETIKRLRLVKGRAASLLGLQLLKHGMRANGCAEFDLAAVHFPRDGKPRCDAPHCDACVDFNITHSRELVACALASAGAVGIDTEKIREIDLNAFGRFLDTSEYAQLAGDHRRFFELWTQKEAVVKAHGDGGIANLRAVRIDQDRGTLGSKTWSLRAVNIHPDYVTFVATGADTSVQTTYVELADT
ncbi:MAG: 4'-phosphopantetheinyl transferase family protein [Gammaproteobacteria bacterium]|nr:4'-phosphopantetheinyl transferase superfamily protein [Gammaproteobacteria bacterium]